MGCCWSDVSEVTRKRYLVDNEDRCNTRRPSKMVKKLGYTPGNVQPICMYVARGVPSVRPVFSSLEMHEVIKSWAFLRLRKEEIGFNAFEYLFRLVPTIEQDFVRNSERFQALLKEKGTSTATARRQSKVTCISEHANNVMQTVQKAMTMFDDQDELETLFQEMGLLHAALNTRIEYLDCLIPCFTRAITPVLAERGEGDLDLAWASFFRYCLHIMKESIVF